MALIGIRRINILNSKNQTISAHLFENDLNVLWINNSITNRVPVWSNQCSQLDQTLSYTKKYSSVNLA